MVLEEEEHGGLVWLWLNRPERLNALDDETIRQLRDALRRLGDGDSRVLILGGRGRAFCSGYDLREERERGVSRASIADLERVQEITRLLRTIPQPVIASVHGFALGAGWEIALAADLIVASEETEFGLPEVSLGLGVTGGVTQSLARAIGPFRARESVYLGVRMDASRASTLGLVNKVVGRSQLEDETAALAKSLVRLPPVALTLAKRAMNSGLIDMEVALLNEANLALLAHQTSEAVDALRRFRSG